MIRGIFWQHRKVLRTWEEMGSEDEIFEYIAHFFDVNDSDHSFS